MYLLLVKVAKELQWNWYFLMKLLFSEFLLFRNPTFSKKLYVFTKATFFTGCCFLEQLIIDC